MPDNDNHMDEIDMSHGSALVSRDSLDASLRRAPGRMAGRPRGSGNVHIGSRRSALPGRGRASSAAAATTVAAAEVADDIAPVIAPRAVAAGEPLSQPRLKRRDESRQLELIAELRDELLALALQSSAADRQLEVIEHKLAAGLFAAEDWFEPNTPGQPPREVTAEDFASFRRQVKAAVSSIEAALVQGGRNGSGLLDLDADAWPRDVQHEVSRQREALAALLRDMPLREAAATRLIAAARASFSSRSSRRQPADLARRWEMIERRARGAEAQFVQANQGLVALVVKRYLGVGLSYPDLMQEGNIGLLRAVEKFDCRRGCRFSTYATWWIRQAVRRALANQARTIRLPVHTADARYALRQASSRLEARLGREASSRELAEHMGVAASKVGKLMNLVGEPVSLEAPRGDGGDTCLYDSLSDSDAEDPSSYAHERQVKGHLEHLVSTLPAREAKMVRLRFGLDGRHERTLDEVGLEFGLTRERVRQLLEKALARLRHAVPDDWRAAES